MRYTLLAGVAGLALCVAIPAFAAPLQVGLNIKYHSHNVTQDVSNQKQTIKHDGNIWTYPGQPEAIQVGVNASIDDKGSSQTIDQDQTVNGPKHGVAFGTQAVQIGANVNYETHNSDQSLSQTQTVNDNGHGGVTAVQVGGNVAIQSSGGSQTINQTQTVSE